VKSRAPRPATNHKKPPRKPDSPPNLKRAGKLFAALVALQARLRGPRGCPWDREQTHESLRTFLLEETYEVLEALDAGEASKLAGELGDLLLQIVFHAEMAREAGRFDIGDVIEQIHAKMVRRHPHVFGDARAKTSGQVLKNWEQLKAEERRAEHRAAPVKRKAPVSLLDGVPRTLPALLEALQLTRRASRVGFDWEDTEALFDKLAEETAELRKALVQARAGDSSVLQKARVEEEVGDLLFVAANVARFLGIDPEIALKKANRKFTGRFQDMERQAARAGKRLAEVPRDDLEELWTIAKGKRPGSGGSADRSPAARDVRR
jgi:tetrapyrrole methylase family protein/MazG family protein